MVCLRPWGFDLPGGPVQVAVGVQLQHVTAVEAIRRVWGGENGLTRRRVEIDGVAVNPREVPPLEVSTARDFACAVFALERDSPHWKFMFVSSLTTKMLLAPEAVRA